MLFSVRNGISRSRDVLQFETLDDRVRKGLWNVLHTHLWTRAKGSLTHREAVARLLPVLWDVYFADLLDSMPEDWRIIGRIKTAILDPATPWFSILDLMELILTTIPAGMLDDLTSAANAVFERENVGYRIIRALVAPVIDEVEIEAIDSALLEANPVGVRLHVGRALELLSDRANPDYRNSVKESISAVEAACKVVLPKEKQRATLGEALAALERTRGLHSSLKSGFSSLYGYTSDADGIRHALMEDPSLGFNEAKLFLVACSAFANYILMAVGEAPNGSQIPTARASSRRAALGGA